MQPDTTSSSSSQTAPQADDNSNTSITPPWGWTKDPDRLNFDYYWADAACDGQVMAAKYGLRSARPVMCSDTRSGDSLWMFQAGPTYYIWNEVEGDVFEVVKPTGLQEIVATITDKGLSEVELNQLEEKA